MAFPLRQTKTTEVPEELLKTSPRFAAAVSPGAAGPAHYFGADPGSFFTAARGAGTLSGPAKALSVGAMESIRVADESSWNLGETSRFAWASTQLPLQYQVSP